MSNLNKTILAATLSKHKLMELQTVAKQFGIEIISPIELLRASPELISVPKVEENEKTYSANAYLKASAFSKWSGMTALGDDSGLEVAALDNRPGVYSARYAGEKASDIDRINKILTELNVLLDKNPDTDLSACFRCSLSLVYPNEKVLESESCLSGRILMQPRGNKGFGYDPIVYIDELGSTLAEVDFSVTCSRGFRAKAAYQLFSNIH